MIKVEAMSYGDWFGMNVDRTIITQVQNEWETLINEKHREQVYHNFIRKYAGFFFFGCDCYLCISKFKLGSEYESDFVKITDRRSYGVEYEFIEIEKPSSQLFTKDGIPAKDLNTAIQQIRDWKRFLREDKVFFRKFLPAYNTRVNNDSCLKFTIIIGRREESDFNIEKRNQISKEIGVEIRSFDYLTDLLKKREFFNNTWLNSDYGKFTENQLENPFAMAVTDSEWKIFCKNMKSVTHFYSNNCHEVINMRRNNPLYSVFKKGNK